MHIKPKPSQGSPCLANEMTMSGVRVSKLRMPPRAVRSEVLGTSDQFSLTLWSGGLEDARDIRLNIIVFNYHAYEAWSHDMTPSLDRQQISVDSTG